MWLECLVCMALLAVSTVSQYIVLDQGVSFFREFDWQKKHEWVSRVNATCVELAVLIFAAVTGETSTWGNGILFAHFVHDMLHTLVYDHDITNYVHHIVGIALMVLRTTVMTPEQSTSTFLSACTLETTSPFLHATWLMRAAGYTEHPLFKYLAGFAVVFFGIVRVVVFPLLMYWRMDKVTAAVFSPLLGLNIYWFYKLVQMARKAFATKSGGSLLE